MKNYKILFISIFVLLIFSNLILAQTKNKRDRKPPIAPVWSLKHRVWEDVKNTDRSTIKLIEDYKKHNIPVGSVIIDSPWSTGYNNFEWDKTRYPNPQKMIDDFHNQNIKVLLWFTPVLNSVSKDAPLQKDPDYDFVIEKGFAINNGEESKWWKGSGIHIDFTNPEASAWFNKRLKKISDMGIDVWKPDQAVTDFGDEIITSIGMMSNEEYRPYPYWNAINYLKSLNPNTIIKSRGYSHQGGYHADVEDLTICYSGDFAGSYQGLKHQIDNTYKSAKLGYGNLTFEIAGFWGDESKKNELIRYVQFAAFCSAMDNGGANAPLKNHLPWFHDKETIDIYCYYVTLHHELIPYIFSLSVNSHLNGGSMLKETSLVNESHKFGEQIFIKAITSDDNIITVHLPKTNYWIDYWTGEVYKPGEIIENKYYSIMQYPIFFKAGSIIPMNISNNLTGHGYENSKDKETILIYPMGESNYLYHKPRGEGVEYDDVNITVNTIDNVVTIKSEVENDFLFLIKSQTKPKEVTNVDKWSYNDVSKIIKIEVSGKNFSFSIYDNSLISLFEFLVHKKDLGIVINNISSRILNTRSSIG